MSDSELKTCSINEWALSKSVDLQYQSESESECESCSSTSITYEEIAQAFNPPADDESCSSIVYEVIHVLNKPAADDSIFHNNTVVDEKVDNESLTSNRSPSASILLDNSDNDPDFNIDDEYESDYSDDELDITFSQNPCYHSTPETHRIPDRDSCNSTFLDNVCNVDDFISISSDGENNGENNTTDNQYINVHSIVNDKGSCQKSVDSEVAGTSNKNDTKKHVCPFCEKSYSKIVRHFEQKHGDEVQVAKALSYPKKSKERHALWIELQHKGDFAANKPVMMNKVGTFIPARKPKKDIDISDYIPCPHCLGTYKRTTLWRHTRKCLLKSEQSEGSEKASTLGKCLIPIAAECGNSFKLNILSKMHRDRVYFLIEKDPLIIRFGEQLYVKHRDQQHKHNYVKQKMRELGRFLQTYIKMNGHASLSDAIHSSKFKGCVEAVKHLCSFDDDKGSCAIPSLALKIGQSLTACALIKKAEALEAGDTASKKAMDAFITLYNIRWNVSVSSLAQRSLYAKSFNNPKLIPLARDIQKMNNYLEKRAQEVEQHFIMATKQSREDKEPLLRRLRELTLAQIVLFNRRRGGEAQRIEVQQVRKGFLSKHLHDDVMNSLSKFEQKLAKRLERIEIRGKRGRRVPVLLTERHKRRVLILLEHDTGDSKYLFPLGKDTTLCTWKILSDAAKACGAEKPELLTSTNLRKHIGTVSQILNLQEHELDSIADFLGHDVRVHRKFYRLSEDTIQLAKVSKLLVEMESGNVVKHKNKTLEEIECTEEEEVAMDEDSDIDVPEQENTEVTETERDAPMEEAELSSQQAVSDVDVEGIEEKDDEPPPKKKRQKKKKVMTKRLPWTDEESGAVFKGLGHSIRLRKVPGKLECVTLLKKYPCLHRRTWTHIKFFVKNYLDKTSKSAGSP